MEEIKWKSTPEQIEKEKKINEQLDTMIKAEVLTTEMWNTLNQLMEEAGRPDRTQRAFTIYVFRERNQKIIGDAITH